MMDFLFHFSAMAVVPFWLIMILFPNKDWAKKLIKSEWIIIAPVLCYTCLLIPNLSIELISIFKETSPQALANIFSEPWAASLMWAYAGAFDLFVGRWIFFDSQERNIKHFYIVPILSVAVFFGPIGYLCYIILRLVKQPKNLSLS